MRESREYILLLRQLMKLKKKLLDKLDRTIIRKRKVKIFSPDSYKIAGEINMLKEILEIL